MPSALINCRISIASVPSRALRKPSANTSEGEVAVAVVELMVGVNRRCGFPAFAREGT